MKFVKFEEALSYNNEEKIVGVVFTSKSCPNCSSFMDNMLLKKSFLDSYVRMKYVENIKTCSATNLDKNLEYAKNGVELLKEAVKIQPLYTKYWIYLGSFTNALAYAEKNEQQKQNLSCNNL